jgi:large conductance mechanosensitive channel
LLKDFKTFVIRGNVIDMAIGIIIGAAFGAVVVSLVKDIIMPPIGLALSGIDFSSLMAVIKQGVPPGPYANPDAAIAAKAVTINYGTFLLTVIGFLIIAAVVFFFIVRPMARAFAPKKVAESPVAPTTKDCPYCYTAIPIKDTRCPNCTSELSR